VGGEEGWAGTISPDFHRFYRWWDSTKRAVGLLSLPDQFIAEGLDYGRVETIVQLLQYWHIDVSMCWCVDRCCDVCVDRCWGFDMLITVLISKKKKPACVFCQTEWMLFLPMKKTNFLPYGWNRCSLKNAWPCMFFFSEKTFLKFFL